MLVLKSPAKELSLPNTKGLRNYVSTHFPRWQRFLTDDLDLVDDYLKRMYFVRGWLKTTADWTVTAFVSSGAKWKIHREKINPLFFAKNLATLWRQS